MAAGRVKQRRLPERSRIRGFCSYGVPEWPTKPWRPAERVGVDMEDGQAAAPDRLLDFDDTFRRCFGPMVRSLAVHRSMYELAALNPIF